MRRFLNILAVVILMASLSATRVYAAGNDAQAVRTFVAGFATAWNHHDMVAFGKLFAEDADFVTVIGKWSKGRKAIQMHHAWLHGAIPSNTPGFSKSVAGYYGIFKHSTMRFTHIDVRFLRKDVALAHVRWELSGDSRTTTTRRGLMLFVVTKHAGGWLIDAAQNTEINRPSKLK